MKTYEEFVTPYINQFNLITIDKETINKLKNFVSELIKTKAKESHHQIDSKNEEKRFTTGFLGEIALGKMLGIEIMDWTIGESSRYNVPDLSKSGYNIGVKTVEFKKFPVIYKKSTKPEIILLIIEEQFILCCGLATPEQLNKYQDDKLILSPGLRAKGTKTGYYNFEDLKRIKKLSDIEQFNVLHSLA